MNEQSGVGFWNLLLAAVLLPAAIWAQDDPKTAEKPNPAASQAQPPPDDLPVHAELIALRERILQKYDAKDMDGLVAELADDVVATWQDGTVCRGPKAIRDYYDAKIGRPDSIVKDVKTKCVIDNYSRLYNDRKTAIVDGRLEQEFLLRDGMHFKLTSPWTASVVKQGDDWKLSSIHVSVNMFNNGVLDLYVQQNRLWTGIAAGIIGIGVGLLIGILYGGRRSKKLVGMN